MTNLESIFIRFLCPWNFPGKNTGVDCHALFQGSSWPRDRTWVSCIGRQGSSSRQWLLMGSHSSWFSRVRHWVQIGRASCRERVETVSHFIFWGSKITADDDCSHEIKRRLLLGRKVMTNLESIFKSRDITLPTKVHLVKAMVFPVWMASPTRWTWVWMNSRSWWWTGMPGMLRFMGSQSLTWLSNWSDLILQRGHLHHKMHLF